MRIRTPRGIRGRERAGRLRHDPAIRWIFVGKAAQGCAASPSQRGRFETKWLGAERTSSLSLSFRGNGSTAFMLAVCQELVLDMDSSVSPTHGEQG
jgi:hypothetical protein